MLDAIRRFGYVLPGLHRAEPSDHIPIGLAIVLIGVILLCIVKVRAVRWAIAIAVTSLWTVVCGLMILYQLMKGQFVGGRISEYRQQLIQVTLPMYYICGCVAIWTTSLISRFWLSKPGGFKGA